MTPAAGDFLDVFTVLEQLLPGADLTASQLAEVRAANTKFYTELFALRKRARSEGRPWTEPSPAERAALQAMLVDDLRSMITEAQRPEFERRAALLDR